MMKQTMVKWVPDELVPLTPRMSNKLYDQNLDKYMYANKKSFHGHTYCSVKLPLANEISTVSYHIVGKFTIVEIVYGGHHYHGLASRAPCDVMKKGYAGIAIAYNRAFKAICEDIL